MSSDVDDAASSTPSPDKPLPKVPSIPEVDTEEFSKPPPNFTPQAITHFRNIILQALTTEQLDPKWLTYLERSLLELYEVGNQQKWFPGLKHSKELRRRHARQVVQSDNDQTSGQASPVNTSADNKGGQSTSQDKPPTSSEISAQALCLLQDAVASSTAPRSSTQQWEMNHFLLTLNPSPHTYGFSDLRIEFDLRPHRETCHFLPNSFSLPYFQDAEGKRNGQGGTIITGFEDWKRKLSPFFE